MQNKPITILTDDAREVVRIEGVLYSYELFRYFASNPSDVPDNEYFKIGQTDDTVLVIEKHILNV